MEPLAYIILSNLPGTNRLKNIKYYLRIGDNVVGTDSRCQIVIPPQYQMLQHAVNISIGFNFMTVEALQSQLVYVEANMGRFRREHNSDNYFPLTANVKYLPRIGQFFYIGRIKAVIGTASSHQLLQMKNIVNCQLFGIPSESRPSQYYERPIQKEQEDGLKYERKVGVQNMFDNVTLEDNVFNPYQQVNMAYQPARHEPMVIEGGQRRQNYTQKMVSQQQHHQQMESQKSKTEKLDQSDYMFEATIVLEDGIFANEPTINLEDCPFPYEYKNQKQQIVHHNSSQKKSDRLKEGNSQPFSQEILMEQIRRQSKQNSSRPVEDQEIEFSMPDTIVEKEPEDYPMRQSPNKKDVAMRQVQSRQEGGHDEDDDDDQMPPTIQQNDEAIPSQKLKPTKTMQANQNKERYTERLYRSDQVSFGNSFQKEQMEVKDIENFDDLFGIGELPPEIKPSIRPSISLQSDLGPSLGLMNVSLAVQQKRPEADKSEDKSKKRNNRTSKKEKEEEDNFIERVNIVGFKPTVTHRDNLRKQGYLLVSHPADDYGILLVKEPIRLCNKLLHALLEGKRIESDHWIFNKDSQIQSKINDIPWKQIYQKRGNHGPLLKGKRFYVSKRVQDLLQGVIQRLGGEVIDEIDNSKDKRKVLHLILRTQDSLDTEFYLKYRQVKKWKFYRSELIVDTVLTANFSLDQRYMINIFDE